jgi:hypothetical protein
VLVIALFDLPLFLSLTDSRPSLSRQPSHPIPREDPTPEVHFYGHCPVLMVPGEQKTTLSVMRGDDRNQVDALGLSIDETQPVTWTTSALVRLPDVHFADAASTCRTGTVQAVNTSTGVDLRCRATCGLHDFGNGARIRECYPVSRTDSWFSSLSTITLTDSVGMLGS